MLVLSRKPQETIVVDGRISITVVEVRGNQVRLGIEAPRDVSVQRQELLLPTEQREVLLPLVSAPKFSAAKLAAPKLRAPKFQAAKSARPRSQRRHAEPAADFRPSSGDLFATEAAGDSATSAAL